jgi:hypothetical protein
MKQLYSCFILERLSIAAENQISDCFFYAHGCDAQECARKSILKSALAAGSKREGREQQEKGAGRGRSFLLLRTISYFTYEMVNNQSETARTAVSGSAGQDVRCSRLVRLNTIYPFH